MKKLKVIASVFIVGLIGLPALPSQALTAAPKIAQDKESGYDRSLFKHWVDVDNNGCDTKAEVLLEQATITPKIGAKCKLTGGKWLSAYDGKNITNVSQLEVAHVVPLAEAWRSGAWRRSNVRK